MKTILSKVIQKQAEMYSVDIGQIAEHVTEEIQKKANATIDMNFEVSSTLTTPFTAYYPDDKLAKIFVFPRVFAMKDKEERVHAIKFNLKHEIYETFLNIPGRFDILLNDILSRMLPSFDHSALKIDGNNEDEDILLHIKQSLTDVGIDRFCIDTKDDMIGFATYQSFPHYNEVSRFRNILESVKVQKHFTHNQANDIASLYLSGVRRKIIGNEKRHMIKGTKYWCTTSAFNVHLDNIRGKLIKDQKLTNIALEIVNDAGNQTSSINSVYEKITSIKDGLLKANF